MTLWNNAPFAGEVWRSRQNGKTETRRVIDRTLGGDVLYQSGKRSCWNPPTIGEYQKWVEWQAGAKFLSRR